MMSYPTEKPQLVIKDNNTGGNEPCALCGRWDEAPIGPAIFVESTWNIVCYGCAIDIAPGLVDVVRMWERAEAQRFHSERHLPKSLGGENPFIQEPPPGLLNTIPIGDDVDLDVWGEALQ